MKKITIITVFFSQNTQDFFLRYYYSIQRVLDLYKMNFDIQILLLDNYHKPILQPYLYTNGIDLDKKYYHVVTENVAGFAPANNYAFAYAQKKWNPDYVLFLNPDTEIDLHALNYLVDTIEKDDMIFSAEARQYPFEHPKKYDTKTNEVSWSSGACLLVDAQKFAELKGFDEVLHTYVEDVDLSWRAWNMGWKCMYVPDAVCTHHTYGALKDPYMRQFWAIRNNLIMRFKYKSWKGLIEGIQLVTNIMKFHKEHKLFADLVNVRRALFSALKSLFRVRQVQCTDPNVAQSIITFYEFDYAKRKKQ